MSTLLEPALLAQLERLQLSTRRRLAGRFSGEHRSPRFGTSLDFADVRDYHPGDDYRRIDYPLYARTGNLFVKLFDAEDDLAVHLLVDVSASMGHAGKLDHAARLAAAFGFLALTRRDVVTVHLDPARAEPRRFSGRSAIPALMALLESLQPAGPTDLGGAAHSLLSRPGPAGSTIVISDLLTPTWEAAIDRLPARGGDVTVVHVLSPEELEPQLIGDLDVIDAETGEQVPISASQESLASYRQAVAEWLGETEARCHSRGATYQLVRTDQSITDVILGGARQRGIVR